MRAILKQELTFSGNASDAECVAYFPNSLAGQYIEFTVYPEWSTLSEAGAVQIETAFGAGQAKDYSGVWAAIGNPIAWGDDVSQGYASNTGVFDLIRVRITEPVTNGTVRVYVTAAALAGA